MELPLFCPRILKRRFNYFFYNFTRSNKHIYFKMICVCSLDACGRKSGPKKSVLLKKSEGFDTNLKEVYEFASSDQNASIYQRRSVE